MEALRSSFLVLLAIIATGSALVGAELSVSPDAGRAGYFFADVPIRVKVRISALEVSEKELVRMDWLDYLEWRALAADGTVIPVSVISTQTFEEKSIRGHSARTKTVENLWSARGMIVLSPFPSGAIKLAAAYRGTHSSETTLFVKNGDENNAIAAARLAVEGERHGIPFEEFRTIQLKRLELQPTNEDILWELAWASRFSATTSLEEIDGYYARAIEIGRKNLATMKSSNDEGLRRYAQSAQPAFEQRERNASAIRALLPEFCKHRDKLWIDWSVDEKSIELQERVTHKTIRSIDVTSKVIDDQEAVVLDGSVDGSAGNTRPND